jgi:hypothetical protein
MVATLLFLALVLAVGLGVWEAWRRSGAIGSLSGAFFMAALLFPGRATLVLVALGLGCFAWWVLLRLDRTARG